MANTDAEQFFQHFLAEQSNAGLSVSQIADHTWRPFQPSDLNILGDNRDADLSKLAISEAELRERIYALPEAVTANGEITAAEQAIAAEKLVLVLVPGFTHETLKNLSWHQHLNQPDLGHHSLILQPPNQAGGATQETLKSSGDGLKIAYCAYPRSNGDSRNIIQPLFELLHNSSTVRRWVQEEGCKLLFVGYSYGAPLSLELFAALNAGRIEQDDFVLDNTAAFLSLCGDIGGAYLADDVISEQPKFLSIAKVVDFFKRHPRWQKGLLGKLAGVHTEQLLADLPEGAASLGHAVRQQRMAEYAPELPAHIHYFSVAALYPPEDYRRYVWQLNLDDYAMYKQSLITAPITVYNDGQVALPDNLLPAAATRVPESHKHFLGAVRTHHWGVSYQTFNFGKNRFPRAAFYRALLRVVAAKLG